MPSWSVWWARWHPYWVWHSTGDGDGYWVDEGWYDFFRDNYSASMTATTRIEPDEKVPTAAGNTMKSGYGVGNTVTATVRTSAPMSHYTYGQTAVSYSRNLTIRPTGACWTDSPAEEQPGFSLPQTFTAPTSSGSIFRRCGSLMGVIRSIPM